MDAAGYTTLTRQAGLMREMQAVAHNIANMSTTGFRREGVVFTEYVQRMGDGPSLSMATGNALHIDLTPAGASPTGGTFDFAIQGEGFFLIDTPDGRRLSRAGSFTPSAAGELVNSDGLRLLDQGGAPVVVPPNAGLVALSTDGTLSSDGTPIGKIGLWKPTNPVSLEYQSGTLFNADGMEPVADGVILQGFLEDSNVQPVAELARMIEVQRAYEMGQSFMDDEDKRMRAAIQALGA